MPVPAERLGADNKLHLERAAQFIKRGGIIAFPFNGIFGLFGDIDNPDSYSRIIIAKNRPEDKRLIAVSPPENVGRFVDFSRQPYPEGQIKTLWKEVHALGIILPASECIPKELTVGEVGKETLINIWTEYHPLRNFFEYLENLKIRGLVGTSANKSGQPTHIDANDLWCDFNLDVDAVVETSFDNLPAVRKKSTSIIDLTSEPPRLHRLGNVSEEELQEVLEKNGFSRLAVQRDFISVRGRGEIAESIK